MGAPCPRGPVSHPVAGLAASPPSAVAYAPPPPQSNRTDHALQTSSLTPQLHETQSLELSNAAMRVVPWVTAHRHLQPRNLANRQIALHKLCVCVPAVPLPNGLAPNSSMHLHRALSRTNSIMRMRRLCPKCVAPRALPTSPCRNATPQQSNAHGRCATPQQSNAHRARDCDVLLFKDFHFIICVHLCTLNHDMRAVFACVM